MLLVGLGRERAAEVFRHLKDDEIEALSLDITDVHVEDVLFTDVAVQ